MFAPHASDVDCLECLRVARRSSGCSHKEGPRGAYCGRSGGLRGFGQVFRRPAKTPLIWGDMEEPPKSRVCAPLCRIFSRPWPLAAIPGPSARPVWMRMIVIASPPHRPIFRDVATYLSGMGEFAPRSLIRRTFEKFSEIPTRRISATRRATRRWRAGFFGPPPWLAKIQRNRRLLGAVIRLSTADIRNRLKITA